MTFAAKESSRQEGKPILVYRFIIGAATPLLYTNAVKPQDDGTYVYLPYPIDIDSITSDGTLDKSEVKITLQSSNTPLADMFAIYPPPVKISVIVKELHVADGEFKLAFPATVLAGDFEGGDLVLTCESVLAALRRVVLRPHYNRACGLPVYQAPCPASKPDATGTVVVSGVDTLSIDVPAGWHDTTPKGALAKEKFLGGTVEWLNSDGNLEVRGIVRVADTSIDINGPVRDLAALDSVAVVAACNRQLDDCGGLHGVVQDHDGAPWIPNVHLYAVNNFY